MSVEVVFIGYKCPLCGSRVQVLRSSDPLPATAHEIISECKCGYIRPIKLHEIQDLEVWKEEIPS